MKGKWKILAIAILIFFALSDVCRAYPVGPSLKLEQLIAQSPVIFKATVISSATLKDEWFTECRGFDAYATEMKLVSTIKGKVPGRKMVFQHYGPAKNFKGGLMFMPQKYDLQVGRTYIVFARETEKKGVYRQLWKYHKDKSDQGVILAADNLPVAKDKTVKEIIWAELNKLLASPDSKDVVYAIRQLDEMSNQYEPWGSLDDFDRNQVVAQIEKFIFSREKAVARQALMAVGAASPYIHYHNELHWLATVGGGTFRGISKRDATVDNESARKYWKDLVAVADGKGSAEIRALAVGSLGRSSEPGIYGAILRWLNDPEPLVRKTAVILLSEFPRKETAALIAEHSGDEAAEVRVGAANAVGFGQFGELLPLLDRMLKDEDIHVRTAAALSIVSFSPAKAEKVLKANIDDPDFKSVFVNALAEKNPEPYLDYLAEIIEKRLEPRYFWGGTIPWWASREILSDYLAGPRAASLDSARREKYLAVIEKSKARASGKP